MRKVFFLVFLIVIFLAIFSFFLIGKEVKIISKIEPKKAFQEFVEKTEKEIQEKKENNLPQSEINPQEMVENIVKKSEDELKKKENKENFQFACEKINKREEVLIKFKEFLLKLEIELEVKGEKEKKCNTIISIKKLIDFKKNNENVRKEDFEFLKEVLEGKRVEVLISKEVLFEILKKIENKEMLIF
jgi:hypothetical protein